MIKAKKGLLIALFAAMMVFAFGATSVFADNGDTVWNSENAYASGTYESDGVVTKYDAKRFWNYEEATKGSITAQLWTSAAAGQPEPAKVEGSTDKKFFDLNNAFVGVGETQYSTWTYNQLATGFNATTGEVASSQYDIVLVQPSYTDGYDAAKIGKAVFVAQEEGHSKHFNVTVYAQGFDPESYAPQKVTLHTEIYGTHSAYADELYGEVPDQEITVQGRTPDASQLEVKVDGDSEATDVLNSNSTRINVGSYDGDTHVLVTKYVPGFTVKYTLQNDKTKVYEPVDKVEFKDAGTYVVKMQRWNTTTDKAVGNAVRKELVVSKAGTVLAGFDPDGNEGDYKYSVVEGETYDLYDYVIVEADEDSGTYAADKKAVAANEAEFKAMIKDALVIDAKAPKATPNMYNLTLKANPDLDSKAFVEKYAALMNNFEGWDYGETQATLKITNPAFDEVLFTNAPDMTYHVKKAKKLKKTKSFTVEAVAASGKTVTYKIDSPSKKISIDPATGKITVKKGLKKGTYKVLVIAGTEEGAGYQADFAYRQLTIKVKK